MLRNGWAATTPETARTFSRVWAPHAEAVSLVGDFNSWDPAECPMERLEDSDIWEGVRAGIQEYDCYKYAVVSREGEEPVLKSDPYATTLRRAPPTPPRSIIWRATSGETPPGKKIRPHPMTPP